MNNVYKLNRHPLFIEKEDQVLGYIGPVRWNTQGEAEEFSVFTDEFEDILIQSKSIDLRKYIGRRVKAIGKIVDLEEGQKLLKVKKIIVIKGPCESSKNKDKFYNEYSVYLPKKVMESTWELESIVI